MTIVIGSSLFRVHAPMMFAPMHILAYSKDEAKMKAVEYVNSVYGNEYTECKKDDVEAVCITGVVYQ